MVFERVAELMGVGTGLTGSLNNFDLAMPSASFKVLERINM